MIADFERLSGPDGLTDSQLWRIDQICDGFETAWNSARRPEIEEFLDASTGRSRELLLRELLRLDVHYRRRQGESPTITAYRERFPELAESSLDAELAPDPRDDEVRSTGNGDRAAGYIGYRRWALPHAQERPPKFKLLERVGVGGFGTVWRALDLRLNRTVAIKIPHAHLVESANDVARFDGEARAAAGLRHPGIVTVHDVTEVDGLPALVCDFVTGKSLRDLIATSRMDRRAAAVLIAKVADALAYAHSMGAIHRDIKPANIMLDNSAAESGGVAAPAAAGWPGEPRIVDFGFAFLEQESVHLTEDGAIIGTPAYMSPEQALGRDAAHPLDHRCDIYGLGVVLFELLTGALPFAGTRSELLRKVIGSEPPSPRRMDRAIPRDLESICLKAIAKDPRDRYSAAGELALDLRHFLDGEPVRARPISLWQRVLRRAQRRPAEAASWFLGVVTLLAVIGLAVGFHYHLRLQHELSAADAARHLADQERQRAETFLYFHRMALAEREWTANNVDRALRLLEDCPPPLRGWEWRYLEGQCHHDLISMDHATSPNGSWSVTGVQYSPEGRVVASTSRDGTVRLWDPATGRLIKVLGRHTHAAFALAFHPGGRVLASAGELGEILFWDTETKSLLRALRTESETIYALAYSPDGRQLAFGDGFPPFEEIGHMRGRGVVRVSDAATGQVHLTLRGHTQNVMGVAFSPDGRTLASTSGSALTVPQTANKPGELILWDTASGDVIHKLTGHTGPLTGVSYHPIGRLIATSSWDRTIKLWNAQSGDLLDSLAGHQDWVSHVAFSPDGARIASSGADGAIKIWDCARRRELWTLRGHTKNVTCVTFSPDGRRLASSSSDQTVRVWDGTASPEALVWRGSVEPIAKIAFFPDGKQMLVARNSEDASGRVRHRMTILELDGNIRETAFGPSDDRDDARPIDGIAIRSDGSVVASASQSGLIEVRTVAERRTAFRYEERTSRFQDISFSPDGRRLAAAGQVRVRLDNGDLAPYRDPNGLLLALDAETGELLWRVAGLGAGLIRDLAFSPDGRLIATADNSGTVTVVDSQTGKVRQALRGHSRLVSHVAFDPSGAKLASASWDSTVIVWDVAKGRASTRLQGHMRSVLCVAFSPDGRRLATSSEDQSVRLWDVETGQEVLNLHGHSDIVPTVAFSPDGSQLATAGADGVVQVRWAKAPSRVRFAALSK
jgi:eukaryotic-like serine/threonine-protein kinase